MLIIHSKTLSDDKLSDFTQHIPGIVLVSRIIPGFAYRYVGLDSVSGTLVAIRMLFNRGRQHIGYLPSNHGIEDDDVRRKG